MTREKQTHGAFRGKMHTAYKHEILKKYLLPWMQILQSANPIIAYVDCHAGPGIYPDGTKGSPHIALDAANSISSRFDREVWCIFNDNDRDKVNQLQQSFENRKDSENILVFTAQTDANELVDNILNDDRFALNGHLRVPMFFFIDPFGFNVSMEMLKKIVSQSKTEILVTFMIKDVIRWGETPAYEKTMTELFGHPNPMELIDQIEGRDYEQRAVNAFISRLQEYANVKHVMRYRICSQDERRTKFYMVHGTNHFKGFNLMKTIMYNIGIPGTFAYLGPDHPDEFQTQLDTYDAEVQHLMNYLTEKYAGESRPYQRLLEETLAEVPHIERHFLAALKKLEAEGRINVSGPIGKRGGFQRTTVFEFTKGP